MESSCTDTSTTDSVTCQLAGSQNSLAVFVSALSAMGLSSILLMQLDGISRRILSPPRLLA